MSKLRKVVTKPIRMPLNWVMPRHVVNGAKEFKFSRSRYPICPSCSLARFSQKPEPNDNGDTLWFCQSCDFEVTTHHPTLESIQSWCRENAKDTYSDSPYQQERLDNYHNGDSKGFIAINIRRNMLSCYGFMFLASLTGLLFIYAAYNTLFLFMMNSLLFSLAFLFMALIFNYRSWQAMTNNVYNLNAKQQFHWWVKTHPWFCKPRDIGTPPQDNSLDQ